LWCLHQAERAGHLGACAASEKSLPEDLGASLTNAAGKESYPLGSFTWIYDPASGLSAARSRALKEFWNWALSDGQEIAGRLGYAQLPPNIAEKAEQAVSSIQ
jgi:phosphate transport system substrate-binding protein